MRQVLAGVLFLSAVFLPGKLSAAVYQSGPEQAVLIELFSSEGCNSCPPADEQLNALSQNPKLWKSFVPAAFHVDYWDSLGWKDPWSRSEFTERQWRYVEAWGGRSVYTPGFVLNGREWEKALREAVPERNSRQTGILKVEETKGLYHAEFSPVTAPEGPVLLSGALLGMGLVSQVQAGENRGRTLRHDFVVLSYRENLMRQTESGKYTAVFSWTPSSASKSARAAAFWVSVQGRTPVLQAAGGFLES